MCEKIEFTESRGLLQSRGRIDGRAGFRENDDHGQRNNSREFDNKFTASGGKAAGGQALQDNERNAAEPSVVGDAGLQATAAKFQNHL